MDMDTLLSNNLLLTTPCPLSESPDNRKVFFAKVFLGKLRLQDLSKITYDDNRPDIIIERLMSEMCQLVLSRIEYLEAR